MADTLLQQLTSPEFHRHRQRTVYTHPFNGPLSPDYPVAFSALTLLVGQQEGHLPVKN